MADDVTLDIDTSTLVPAGDNPLPIKAGGDDEPKGIDAVLDRALDGYDETGSGSRDRDERGRFRPRETTTDAAPDGTSDPVEVSAESATEETPPTDSKPLDPDNNGHFRGWSKEERDAFGKLAPEAQAFVLARHKASQSHATRVEQELADLRKQADPFQQVIQKRADYLDHVSSGLGIDREAVIAGILDTEAKLRYGTYAEKVQLLQRMAREYGVPLGQQDQWQDPTAQEPAGEMEPLIHDLRQKIALQERDMSALRRQQQEWQSQQVSTAIATFAATKTADGKPAYPHFDAVKGTMANLMETGQAKSMQEAYSLAAKPIEDAVAQTLAARQKAEAETRQAALAKAKANAPIRVSGVSPGGRTQAKGLDNIIGDALSRHGFG